jgi:hypothetical protein
VTPTRNTVKAPASGKIFAKLIKIGIATRYMKNIQAFTVKSEAW